MRSVHFLTQAARPTRIKCIGFKFSNMVQLTVRAQGGSLSPLFSLTPRLRLFHLFQDTHLHSEGPVPQISDEQPKLYMQRSFVTVWTFRGSNPGKCGIFPYPSSAALRPAQPPIKWVPGHYW